MGMMGHGHGHGAATKSQGHGGMMGHGHGGHGAKMGHGHGHGGHGGGMGHGHGHGHGHGGAAATANSGGESRGGSKGYAIIAFVYLFGIVMGALDMSIVNPARTVIQNSLSVDDSVGVWILTIYTLAYAASIPIMGKLADRHGRKIIYLVCILLFGTGSLLCGLSRTVGSFEMLLIARVIQALGGGGIVPVATAEFGTAFPEEKRGMALGLVGMVYGLSSILGPSAGSAILDVFGATEWQYIFFINVPICIVVLVLGLIKLPNSKAEEVKPIDGLGILILTAMTLSLMYGLKNIDFFNLGSSITSTDVWPFLLIFVILLPFFILCEKKAADPVINISYFTNINIVIALLCSIISGIVMMGTIFFPQFCENAMMMKSGSGGYFIALLGLGSAVGSMGSGGLIDKFGVRPVLGGGFLGSAAGSLFMAFVACNNPNMITVCATMVITGLGLGFVMGTPLNYMMLDNTPEEESNSALATLSLVRSMGTAIAPAIMVAFIVHASTFMQDNLMEAMPKEVGVSPLPYAEQIDKKLDDMRADEDTAEMLAGLDIPKLSDYSKVEVQMENTDDSKYKVEISDATIEKLQNSDVTTIVQTTKDMSADIFGQLKPQLLADASDGLASGLKTMKEKAQEMKDAIDEMGDGISGMESGISGIGSGISEMDGKIANANSQIDDFNSKIDQMNQAIPGISTGIEHVKGALTGMEKELEMQKSLPEDKQNKERIKELEEELIPNTKKALADAEGELAKVKEGIAGITSALDGVTTGRNGMQQGRAEMVANQNEMQSSLSELQSARDEMNDAYASLEETITQLEAVQAALPGMFDEAETNYMAAIDDKAEDIQKVYQTTLNSGFRDMAIFVAACSVIGAFLMIPYRDKRKNRQDDDSDENAESNDGENTDGEVPVMATAEATA